MTSITSSRIKVIVSRSARPQPDQHSDFQVKVASGW